MSDDGKAIDSFITGLQKQVSSKKTSRSKRKERPQLSAVDKVMPDVLVRLGLERRLKEHSLMQMWETLLPSKLAQLSRPLFIDSQHTLVISVSDASVAQELSLMRSKLLPQLSMLSKSLGIEFSGFRIDLKHFHKAEEAAEPPPEEPLPVPLEEDLDRLILKANDMALIQDLSNKLQAENREAALASRIVQACERRLKLDQWRRQHGYPICQSCEHPVGRLHQKGQHKVCFNCMMQTE